MSYINFKFQRIRDVKAPTRGTKFSAGLDFYIPNDYDVKDLIVRPHGSIIISTGIKIDMMCQDVAFVAFNKSGIATKLGLTVGACVVDSDYQGELFIHLFNMTDRTVWLNPGDKIVQLVALPIYYTNMIETSQIFETKTDRGEGRMGSTGM